MRGNAFCVGVAHTGVCQYGSAALIQAASDALSSSFGQLFHAVDKCCEHGTGAKVVVDAYLTLAMILLNTRCYVTLLCVLYNCLHACRAAFPSS